MFAAIRIVSGLFLALVFANASAASTYKGRCTDSVTLGHERWPELKVLFAKQRDAVAQSRHSEAIETQKEIVELQCHNHFLRYYLAELLLGSSRQEEAVAELEALYDLRVNDLEPRLRDEKNALYPLSTDAAYLGSRLARRVEQKRLEFEARRAKFVAKLQGLSRTQRPPDPYAAVDVCPFECCSYGKWTAREAVSLVANPGSSEIVAKLVKGDEVESETGQVHTQPIPVAVVFDEAAYQPTATIQSGSIVFLLDSMGEGFSHVWHAGKVHEMSTSGEVHAQCSFPDEDCWGEYLEDLLPKDDGVWWVKIRLPDGTIGWTSEQVFDGPYGCG